jgi:hypothetical protein
MTIRSHVEPTPTLRETQMDRIELEDTRRRINNLLAHVCPVADLALDEARAILAALGGVVRARQGDGTLTVSVEITSPSGGPAIGASWLLLPNPETSIRL